jgi:hypothetical protein
MAYSVPALPLPIHPVALVYLDEPEPSYQTELVNTIQVERGYQLTSIPFFAKHLALHDIISVETEEGIHYFDDIVVKSGHSVIRVLFTTQQTLTHVMGGMQQLGANAFRYDTSRLVAFDVPAQVAYEPIKQFLTQGEAQGWWEYQEACLGWK